MQTLAPNIPEEDDSDSFAERAENYYRKRPQLLILLQDLYNRYLALADRYCQALKHSSQIPTVISDADDELISGADRAISITNSYPDSDVESSLSFQPTFLFPPKSSLISTDGADPIVVELVAKTVDNDILLHELELLDRYRGESSRKIELQKSLLDVLESERIVLLNENARLGYRATAVAEENKGLASEAAFMKRKATELARCILKMRDDHGVCLLSRKIEDLQGQIHGLEHKNKEYYEQLVRREEEKREVVREVCFQVEKLKLENARLKEEATRAKEGWWKISKWWDRVKKFDLRPLCGSHTYC